MPKKTKRPSPLSSFLVYHKSCSVGNEFPAKEKSRHKAAFRNSLVHAKSFLETVHTSAGIYKLLLPCEERVALRADFDADILFRRPGLDHFATGAPDGGLLILGMNSIFHCFHLFPQGLQMSVIGYHSPIKKATVFSRNFRFSER